MRRQTTSRVLLSVLLLWQLVAGAFAHTHGMAVQNMTAPDADSVVAHESMNHEHCADMNADMQMAMTLDVLPDARSQHSSSQPDCCESSGCHCPCAHAVVVAIALPHVVASRPNAQPLLEPTGSIRDAGVTGLFRPPIYTPGDSLSSARIELPR